MKQIKPRYRAVFQQLKSVAMKCSAAVNVEVIQRGTGLWICQSPDTGVEFRFTPMQSAQAAKQEAESRFEIMLSDGWFMMAKPPDGPSVIRLLEPDEYVEKDGKIYWFELDDFTHIVDPAKPMDPNNLKAVHPAACGDLPKIGKFVSLKANVPPTCKRCAEVYAERFAKR